MSTTSGRYGLEERNGFAPSRASATTSMSGSFVDHRRDPARTMG
jgi:hypothetical protein